LISGKTPDGYWPAILFLHVYDDAISGVLKLDELRALDICFQPPSLLVEKEESR
jgi:hypothetical protein